MNRPLTNTADRNFAKYCIALQTLKESLLSFIQKQCEEQSFRNTEYVQSMCGGVTNTCMECNPLPVRTACTDSASSSRCVQNKACEVLVQRLKSKHLTQLPNWANAEWDLMFNSPWQQMKCFITETGYKHVSVVDDADIGAFVRICINHCDVNKAIGESLSSLKKIVETRDLIFQSETLNLSEDTTRELLNEIKITLQMIVNVRHTHARLEVIDKLMVDERPITVEDEIMARMQLLASLNIYISSLQADVEVTENNHTTTTISLSLIKQIQFRTLEEIFQEVEASISQLKLDCKAQEDNLRKHRTYAANLGLNEPLHCSTVSALGLNDMFHPNNLYMKFLAEHTYDEMKEAQTGIEKNGRSINQVEDVVTAIHSWVAIFDVKVAKIQELLLKVTTVGAEDNESLSDELVTAGNRVRNGENPSDARAGDMQNTMGKLIQNLEYVGNTVQRICHGCMAIYVSCPTVNNLIALCDDFLSGKLTSLFQPLQEYLRTLPGCANVAVIVNIFEKDYLNCIMPIINEVKHKLDMRLEELASLSPVVQYNTLQNVQEHITTTTDENAEDPAGSRMEHFDSKKMVSSKDLMEAIEEVNEETRTFTMFDSETDSFISKTQLDSRSSDVYNSRQATQLVGSICDVGKLKSIIYKTMIIDNDEAYDNEIAESSSENVSGSDEDSNASISDGYFTDESEAYVYREIRRAKQRKRLYSLKYSDNDGTMTSKSSNSAEDEEVLQKQTITLSDYQLELAEKALSGKNTIICAETGEGKSWVALHIIDKHLQDVHKGRPKVALMSRTNVKIMHLSNRVKEYLPHFKTKLISLADEEARNVAELISMNDIICCTPQVLLNNIESNNIPSLSEFSLLVFDECQHTRGDMPYARLGRKYLIEKNTGQKRLPQIVGLTASIGVGRSRTVEEAVDYILHVCALLDVEPPLSTVERYIECGPKVMITPKEETIKMIVKNPDQCKDILLKAMDIAEMLLEELNIFQTDIMEKRPLERDTHAYNKWTMDLERSAQQICIDHQISRDISACAVYLNVYCSAIEVSRLLQIDDVVCYLGDNLRREVEAKHKHTEREKQLFKTLLDVLGKLTKLRNDKAAANPNIRILSERLQKMIVEKGDNSRAIVFVKARATCRALAEYLDKDLQKIAVRVCPLYGKRTKCEDEGLRDSTQSEILQKFRDGFYKVIVCTSVATEGIDVPDCNIVINYNYSGDELTLFHMKGRSRNKDATILVMGDEKQLEQETINAYKENMMYQAIGELDKLDARNIERKVMMLQMEELQKLRYQTENKEAIIKNRSKDDSEIICMRCNTLACMVSDVRKLGCLFIVARENFSSKVTIEPHKHPMKFDGIEKKGKMFCKQCPLDWGIVADRNGVDLFVLKLQSFKLRNTRTGVISQHKKWLDVPFDIPELGLEHIPKFFRKVTGENTSYE